MAKANQRAGWRKSNTRAVAATSPDFGSRGRESRLLLFRVSMLSTLAIVLLALLIYVLYRTPDRDVPLILSVVSASGARSNDDVLFTAPNPFAAEDVALLRAWFGGGEGDPSENVRLVGDSFECSGVMDYETRLLIGAITKPLATVTPGGPDGNTVAMYLSAHGFVDKGTPYLAVGDSRADREETWIPFQELFGEIVNTLDERREAGREIKAVLFIDAARVGPQWDWGQFSESFAAACERLSSAESDRIAVILSASPGQRSWWDPRDGHGLFAQALVEALTGKGDKDSDGTVTVGEIADYLSSQVNQMADATWDASQTPLMVGDQARDWPFIRQPVAEPAPETETVNVDQLRDDLEMVDALWKRHNQLSQQTHPPLSFNPLRWATLEKKLSRLDAMLLAGKGYHDRFLNLYSNCDGELTRFENGPDTLPKESSLPELTLRDYFLGPAAELKDLTEAQRAAFDEMVTNWRTKKPDIAAAVQIPMSEAQAIRFLWSWLEEKNFDFDSFGVASDLLERANLVTGAQPASLIESQFTRMLSARDLSHLDANTIAILADSHLQSRATLCTDDLRACFWIRERFADLESQRLACVDRMLSRDPDEQAAGRARWQRDIRPNYESLAETADAISSAYKLRDEMLHSIPRIAETLMSDLQAFDGREQLLDSQSRWVVEGAIESLAELVESLQLPRDDDNRPIEALQQRILVSGEAAEKAFEALNKRITDRLNDATVETAGDAQGLRQNYALLVGSGTSNAELRQRVHTRICELIGETAGGGIIRPDGAVGPGQTASAGLDLMTIDNRHVWDYWLSASDTVNPTAAAADNNDSGTGQPSPDVLAQSFQNTGVTFRALVANLGKGDLEQRTTADDVMRDPVARSEQKESLQSIRRELERWDTFLRARTVLFSHAPPKVERLGKGRFALDQQLFLFDHATRTMNEFWCEAKPGDQPFFVTATNRLLSSRNQNPLFPTLAMNLDGTSLSARLSEATAAASSRKTLQPEPAEKFRDGTLLKFVLGKNVEFTLDCPAAVPAGYASMWSTVGNQPKTVAIESPPTTSIEVPMFVDSGLPKDEASIEAEVFYRGLRREGRIVFKTITDGKRTVFTLPNYAPPTARVTREKKEPERLLLVMDCSRSMGIPTRGGLSRLGVAQNAVSEFLNGLAADVEVGLILFGDQFGFKESIINPRTGKPSTDGKPKIWPIEIGGDFKFRVEQLSQGRTIDAGHSAGNENAANNPNLDVRVATPIKPLDNNHLRDLKNKIATLGSIGTTPTYRAIVKAYEQLGGKPGHIIVLTDGEPTTVHIEGANVDDLRQKAIKDYNLNKGNIKLTFVRYLISAKQLEDEFLGANFLDAADGKDLLRHLQNVRSNPEVIWERSRKEASSRADFESLVAISEWPPAGVGTPAGQPVLPAELYSIRAMIPDARQPVDASTEVRVEGGEQFELTLADNQLLHRPFDYQYRQLQSIATRLTDASRFAVCAGPTTNRENRQLEMQVSIESASGGRGNGKFTPRPTDIWVELTGINSRLGSRQAKDVYTFSLPEFLVRQPIPILLCQIDGFSQNYDKVEVKAWLRFGEERLAGASVPIDSSEAVTVDGLPGVSFRTQRSVNASGGIRVTVTEQYAAERQPGSLRVLPTPLPNKASTVLYADERVVTRTFDFDDAEAAISLAAIAADEIKRKSTLAAEGVVEIDFDIR